MKKRILQLLLLILGVPVLLFVVYIIIILVDIAQDERDANAVPMDFGSFNNIESSMIDPTTILSSINRGDQNVFNFEPGFPSGDPLFVTSIKWKRTDFLNLATSIFHVVWNESVNDWKLQTIRTILGVASSWNLNMGMLCGVEMIIAALRFLDGRI